MFQSSRCDLWTGASKKQRGLRKIIANIRWSVGALRPSNYACACCQDQHPSTEVTLKAPFEKKGL